MRVECIAAFLVDVVRFYQRSPRFRETNGTLKESRDLVSLKVIDEKLRREYDLDAHFNDTFLFCFWLKFVPTNRDSSAFYLRVRLLLPANTHPQENVGETVAVKRRGLTGEEFIAAVSTKETARRDAKSTVRQGHKQQGGRGFAVNTRHSGWRTRGKKERNRGCARVSCALNKLRRAGAS